MPRWLKVTLKTLAVIFILVLAAYISVAVYVNFHKKTLLTSVTKELNKNLDGSLVIESMEPTILKGFPGISLSLNNVVMKDKQWATHKHTLLDARSFDISVNVFGLLRGAIEINKISISNASIYLYTDSNGYTNTSIFKKNTTDEVSADESGSPTEIRKFNLKNVSLTVDNQKGRKLFQFGVNKLDGKIDYESSGWKAKVQLKSLAKNLAFNTLKGSFIKNQKVEGPFDAVFNNKTQIITVKPNSLNIGDDPFTIGAEFNVGKDPVQFSINIIANKIMWRSASALLAPNIRRRLDQFDLKLPIDVKCVIAGDMGSGGDPKIIVTTNIQDNTLTTPGGIVDSCFFKGEYSNHYIKGSGNNDANSVVKLFGFKGSWEGIPVNLDTAMIRNFDVPVASGLFQSRFAVSKLNRVLGNDLLKFTDGIADVKLKYKANLVNLVLNKPVISGFVNITKADLNYVPRNLRFKDTDISLKFTGPDLFISNLRVQSGKSIVHMGGSVKNFLNLYYSAPEKIIFNWEVRSPQLYLGEFLGFLGARSVAHATKGRGKGTFANDLNEVFDKSKMDIHLRVDKMYYKKFVATNALAQLFISEDGIAIKNFSVKHAGGSINLNGNLFQEGASTRFVVSSAIKKANIKSLFYGFDNFGMKSLSYQNLRGNLFSTIHMEGRISNTGILATKSLKGTVAFDLRQGALLNFYPLIDVGKFAFPLRDLNNITFSNLHGLLRVNGEYVTISPMKVSSSVLNANVSGIYSRGTGTNIALDVPLRNPKKDRDITDVKEREEKRMSGIVLHLLATDGEDGKIKIKFNRNRDKGD